MNRSSAFFPSWGLRSKVTDPSQFKGVKKNPTIPKPAQRPIFNEQVWFFFFDQTSSSLAVKQNGAALSILHSSLSTGSTSLLMTVSTSASLGSPNGPLKPPSPRGLRGSSSSSRSGCQVTTGTASQESSCSYRVARKYFKVCGPGAPSSSKGLLGDF